MPVAKHLSKSVPERGGEPSDQRAIRTRESIDTAFVALLHRRSYDNIRVGDITRKADVGRATFYAHYATKHDLLQSQLRRIVSPMITLPPGEPVCRTDATALFAHIAASPRIYQGLIAGTTAPVVQRMLLRCFEERLQQLAQAQRTPDGAHLPAGLTLHFIASTTLTLVSWHIETQATQTPGKCSRCLPC